MIFDSHCHLGIEGEDPGPALARARAAGVGTVLTVGVDLASSRAAADLSRVHEGVLHSAGLHPNSAARLDDEWPGLEALARAADCCAIGETGLDYYWDRTEPADQKRALQAHLGLAAELDKPVIIHCRDAFADIFEELRRGPPTRGVMHCFSGGVAEARRALDCGYHLSFAGPLTYPRAHALREAAAWAPEDRLLVETDAPFLPPQPHRGATNEPGFIVHTLRILAEVRATSFEHMAEVTTGNARSLFARME